MYKLILLIPTLFLLNGCQNENTNVEVFTFKPNEYDVMFIPEDSIDEVDEMYMDAIIELKAKYPSEFSEMEMTERNIAELGIMQNTDGPSLLISKDGTTIAQLFGKKPKKEIIEKLEITLDQNKKDVPN
ncbi:hypothetical protein ACFOUV_16640 [Oceanobacillus longus]|uniref:Uncharacterized protein n=1 Tax=Oceanobacillus longus TaxID=930120 RepID=A0ABV8GZW6_9BACI